MRRLFLSLALAAIGSPAVFADSWGAIECDKASAADERAICATTRLVQLDAEMSVEFSLLRSLLLMGGRRVLVEEQQAWLDARHACAADITCLTQAYDQRMQVLEAGLDRIRKLGPF